VTLDVILYGLVAVTLAYLIYRYARYSAWWQTDAGRAFMSMKICLFVLTIYGLCSVAIEADGWREVARPIVVGLIWLALVYQVTVVIGRQGGWSRRRSLKDGRD